MSRQITCPEGTINASHEESDDDVTVTFDEIKVVTPKAVLFVIDGDKHWIPMSQIVDVFLTDCEVQMTEWIASEKGLE